MLAVSISDHGGVDRLHYGVHDDPLVGPKQVRVAVRACAINHLDLWVRKGLPHLKLRYPHILGADVVGEVEQLGAGVDHLALGTRVMIAPGVSCGRCERCLAGRDNLCSQYRILGESINGGYAELLTVPVENVLPYPEGVSFTDAAAIPLTFQTAWQMLVDRAHVQPGETVLVLAAGSGVGTAALQIAKLYGARVIATASSLAKLGRAQALGADHVVDHSRKGWALEVKRISGGGVDLVFEHVGASTWAESIRCCRWGGRIVTCGATSGWEATTDLRHVFFRQISILGSTMGSKAMLYAVIRHVQAGALRAVVDRVLPLSAAAEGHRLLEERQVFGKVVLELGA
jgi:NADPH:quinone reductase-like Zn-dependent oxidoreductase